MKKVLVLGAGLVAKPLVQYLLDQPDFFVKVASRTVSKAEKLVGDHPRGEALSLNVNDTATLRDLISEADLAISMVPYAHHVTVANLCIELKKHMVTTSYVSEAMNKLDKRAKDAGVLILNEIGLDPGIDHMSAMRIIHGVQNKGGRIASFYSYCGGLPAPEANTNPWGYKFSWSPRGVVLAGKNSARYLKDKKEVEIPSEDLFAHFWPMNIEGLPPLEAYPNRDSVPYIQIYEISDADSMYRGTLRYPGWCQTLKKVVELGLLDETEQKVKGLSYADFLRMLIKKEKGDDLKKDLAAYLKMDEDSEPIKRFEWLGLFGDEIIPTEKNSPLDVFADRLLEKLKYEEGERDMIVLHHDFTAEYPGKKKEKITSTLIDYGIPHGDSAMSRTVGLPAAIGATLILQGRIKDTGVHIPVSPTIYEPALDELEKLGIICKEKSQTL
ncbi:MAG: saccharopine dehydrogenase NADP-binding domain-containing protein [candidate division Zixibacteria bacterium]|nr:saccharopine dehydrogenase NADP-binding domain-containing protein [candidate division Zixibacteria bacterium]